MPDLTLFRTRTLEAIDDIAGPLPSNILKEFVDGPQTPERAAKLLEPYIVSGTVVSSDSSGLSSLTRSVGVVEVNYAISQMKEIVHAMGTSLGGRAPGGDWIADNTEMIYPPDVAMEDIAGLVLEMHRRFPPDGLRAGFCIHKGSFYEIGGGLYGRDADLVELLAEEHAPGGETLLTAASRAQLKNPEAFVLSKREDLAELGEVWRIDSGPPWKRPAISITPEAARYPIPFPDALYLLIRQMAHPALRPEAATRIRNNFQFTRTIVLLETGSGSMATPIEILETLVLSAQAGKLINLVVPGQAEVIENSRGLLLLSFEDGQQAIDTACELAAGMAETGKAVRVGIDRGPVLLAADPTGRWRILGGPVNMASKQAHELGKPGKIYLTLRAAGGVKLPPPIGRYTDKVSGVELEGLVVNVPPRTPKTGA